MRNKKILLQSAKILLLDEKLYLCEWNETILEIMYNAPKPEDFQNTDFNSLIQFRIKRILMISATMTLSSWKKTAKSNLRSIKNTSA